MAFSNRILHAWNSNFRCIHGRHQRKIKYEVALHQKNQHHHSGSNSMPVQVGQVSHVSTYLVDKPIGSLDSHRQPGVKATGPCSEHVQASTAVQS